MSDWPGAKWLRNRLEGRQLSMSQLLVRLKEDGEREREREKSAEQQFMVKVTLCASML